MVIDLAAGWRRLRDWDWEWEWNVERQRREERNPALAMAVLLSDTCLAEP